MGRALIFFSETPVCCDVRVPIWVYLGALCKERAIADRSDCLCLSSFAVYLSIDYAFALRANLHSKCLDLAHQIRTLRLKEDYMLCADFTWGNVEVLRQVSLMQTMKGKHWVYCRQD